MDSDTNEPTLPPIPLPSSPTQRPSRPSILTRKRTHSSYVTDLPGTTTTNPPSAASSDPAFFSGDETAPGAENYETTGPKRKKKVYSGSWWSHAVKVGRREQKRALSRNFDSGVWMGSDEGSSGLSSDSLGSMEEAFLRDQGVPAKGDGNTGRLEGKELGAASPNTQRIVKRLAVGKTGVAAGMNGQRLEYDPVGEIVYQILDSGKQDVNLSGMGLSDLPTEIAQLATLTTEPPLVKGMLDHGRLFTPQLTMVLSNNLFTRMPTPLLELQNLRVLTLRNNKLTSIPPGIGSLTNLVELNVSGNRLQYLPFEIIELSSKHKLNLLYCSANPWLPVPEGVPSTTRDSALSKHKGLALRRWSRKLLSSSSTDSSTSSRSSAAGAGAPSLAELVLRQLQSLPIRSDLSEVMPDDTPPAVLDSLQQLSAARNDGGRLCTSCKRPFVQAGEEWYEWWMLTTSDYEGIPFRRAACQELCQGKENEWVEREWGGDETELRQWPQEEADAA